MKQYYTYIQRKPDGSPFYVGKGKNNRAYDLKRASFVNKHWHNTIAKYGKNNIKIDVINTASEAEALFLETTLIYFFRSFGYRLVNLTDGGEGASGYRHTKDGIEKMRNAKLGTVRGPHSHSTIEKIRKSNVGKPHKPHSLVSREKISQANKGQSLTPDQRERQLKGLQSGGRAKANAWHASEAGRKWHSDNAKKQASNRTLQKVNCQVCGGEYETVCPKKSKFCGTVCAGVARRRRAGVPERGRRKPTASGVTP